MSDAIGFSYQEEDADGYELTIAVWSRSVLVDGSMTYNNALGDLMRAAAAMASGQWSIDMWHGETGCSFRVRFSLMPRPPGAAEFPVRIEVHAATSRTTVIEPALLDAAVPDALELARAVQAVAAPHISDWWGDDLAFALLGTAIGNLEAIGRAGASPIR